MFSKILRPDPQMRAFCVKKGQLSNLKEILSVRYFEGADVKADILSS